MAVDLNRAGRSYAQSLIAGGSVDKTSAWTFTAQDGDALLGHDGNDWTSYGKAHLGIDTGESHDSKAYWKYPFAKGGKLYRSALIAIRSRSSAQKDKVVYDAAGVLLDEIDGNSDRTHENNAGPGPRSDAGTVHVRARPPRVEVTLQMKADVECAFQPSAEVLDKWNAGVRAESTDGANVIEMYDVIGHDYWSGGGITAESVSAALKGFDGKDIEVCINSPGGDMFEGIAIYNVLQQYPGKVTVKIMALAASAASVIAMAGDDRQIGQGAFIMIHNAWVMAMGNRHDMQEIANYLAPFDAALRDIYVACTGQKASAVEAAMDAETFYSASQAIELGFADKMLEGATKEDKTATEKAKALNSVRKVENVLTRKGGYTRAQARDLIKDLKVGKPDAAAPQKDVTQDADVNATQDAGAEKLLASVLALQAELKKT